MAERMRPTSPLFRCVLTVELTEADGTKTQEGIVVGPYVNKAAVKAGIKRVHREHKSLWGRRNVDVIDYKWQKCRGWDATDER